MSGGLSMPGKGKSAAEMLQELNADHAPLNTPETNERTNEASNVESNAGSNVTTLQGTNVTDLKTDIPASKVDPAQKAAAKGKPGLQNVASTEEKVQKILDQLSDDEIAVVTVRVFGRLNNYMDRYVERRKRANPKENYRKQDAVNEAFAGFVADHPMPPMPDDDGL